MTAPKTEMTTASRRIMRLTRERSRPIARSIPISCWRSKTDMASVLMTPRTAISSAIASSPYMMFSRVLIMPPKVSRMSCWSMKLIAGLSPSALTSACSLALVAPPDIFTKTDSMCGRLSCGSRTEVAASTGSRNSCFLKTAPTVRDVFFLSSNSTGSRVPGFQPCFSAVSSSIASCPLPRVASEPETASTFSTFSMSPGVTPVTERKSPSTFRYEACLGEAATTPGALRSSGTTDLSSRSPLAIATM